MHMAKYITNDSVEINAPATALADAAKHRSECPSTAHDKDEPEHIAKYFAQRGVNSYMEMGAMQAAGTVLGHRPQCGLTARSEFL
jgi:hypothetical protein